MTALQKITSHKLLATIIIVAISALVYYGYVNAQGGSTPTRYSLATVNKGTLIVSVNGTGQVSVTHQVELNPRASGQITSLNISNGEEIEAGEAIATIDAKEAQKSVRNASIALENAKISLAKTRQPSDKYEILGAQNSLEQAKIDLKNLTAPPTALELMSAENAVTQAERDLAQTKDNLAKAEFDSTQQLQKAYDDGYTAVSEAYIDLQGLIDDAYKVQHNDDNTYSENNITSYELLVGKDSPYITRMVADYESAKKEYNSSFLTYKSSERKSDRDTLYRLIDGTYTTVRAVTESLESAKNLLDIVKSYNDYTNYYIASTVDTMLPLMQTDVSTANKHLTALQTAKNNLDSAINDNPITLTNAQNAVTSAEEKLAEQKESLQKLKDGATDDEILLAQKKVEQQQQNLDKLLEGADPLDIRAQELNVKDKENALYDARQTLADYTVKAPFDCIIAKVNVSKGDTVSSGTSIATIITPQMIAEISLNEVDVAKIKVGKKATLTFDAIENLSISGEVAEISTLGTASQGVVNYTVKIAFDTQDERIKPGMSVSASIITDSKLNVLLAPSAAIKTQGDIKYVEKIGTPTGAGAASLANAASAVNSNINGSSSGSTIVSSTIPPIQVQVETGLSNDTETEITSGLNEADKIIERTITSSKTAATTSNTRTGGFGIPGMGGGPR